MNKAYIAAPIFTPHHLAVVAKITALLGMHGYDYFSPYAACQPIWKGRPPSECTAEERRRVIWQNIDGLHGCDLLIAWVGGQHRGQASTDTGVVWEMGYFKSLTLTNTN